MNIPPVRSIVGVVALAIIIGVVVQTGCASIHRSTPQLSAEVSDRVAEMQGLHVLSVRRYFDSERQRVEDFLNDKWIPLFLQNFLAESNIRQDLAASNYFDQHLRDRLKVALAQYLADESEALQIVQQLEPAIEYARTDDPKIIRKVLNDYIEDEILDDAVLHVVSLLHSAEPGRLLMDWAQDAFEVIENQRRTMLSPLDDQEREVLANLASSYGEILAAQGMLTGRLEAAAKVKEQQDSILNALQLGEAYEQTRLKLVSISDGVDKGLKVMNEILESGVVDNLHQELANELRTALSASPEQGD